MLNLIVLLVLVSNSFALECFVCTVNNAIDNLDSEHCLKPTRMMTNISPSCKQCKVSITEDIHRLVRECIPGNEPKVDEGASIVDRFIKYFKFKCNKDNANTVCGCSSDLCNTESLEFNCYQCAYSSDGRRVVANNRVFTPDSSCLFVASNTHTTKCSTQCTEAFKEVRGRKGETEVLLFRDCQRELPGAPVDINQCGQYFQCRHDLCNKQVINKTPDK